MKKYLSDRNEIARINTIFAMVLAMVAISYYYLINLATDLKWVMMCGYFFATIPAFFSLLHGMVTKRCDIILLSTEFLILGVLGFVAKILHGLNVLTLYNYFFSAAYALSTVFVFSFADRVAFGKRFLSKWWIAIFLIILPIGATASLYFVPENLVNVVINVKNIIYLVICLFALAVGAFCLIKKRDTYFSWAYSIYVFFTLVAYIFQAFYQVRWYNLFLMFAVVSIPYVITSAVKCKE
ncbi:MAG: hypothetical protein IJE46_04460 [Clostridia bacterium]|nr:hypothetical protein [Clostridia bacterium]